MNETSTTQTTNTPYDDASRTLLKRCPNLILPIINEIFNTNYAPTEKVTLLDNEFFLNRQNGNQVERITDSNFLVKSIPYHLEFQSSTDGTILIRIFEYDSQIALQNSTLEGNGLKVKFPNTALIYLRHTKNTPDEMNILIEVPGNSCGYAVPVIKVQAYSIEEMFEKHLLFLIPFHIFVYEKDFKEYDTDAKKLEQLKLIYMNIFTKLEEYVGNGVISIYEQRVIIDMSKKVLEHIAENYFNVRKGVSEIMGGKIIELEAYNILVAGEAKGRREDILALLKVLGNIPEFLEEKIQQEKDPTLLKQWFNVAIASKSIDHFIEAIS